LASGPLQLRPGPLGWLVVQLVLLSLLFFWAARLHAPSGGVGRQLGVAAGWLIGGALAVLGAGGLGAAVGGSGPVAREGRAESVYDADARVVTRPLPICTDAAPSVRVLLERGAHPRLDPEGEGLWFDAAVGAGARQVYRLDLATGDASCSTCDEPGSNVRPYPGRLGIVFETDRHADWLDPGNTEVHFLRRRGARVSGPSRRLTRSPGPDDHALLAQGEGRLVWSRRDAGAYEVVSAPLQSAHGALLLGVETSLVQGGGAWLAAAEWSPDARALAVLRGNPFAPLAARGIDFATGSSVDLSDRAVPGGAAFSADGSVVALAGSRRGHTAGLLPVTIGAAFAPFATRIERGGTLYRDTALQLGSPTGPFEPLPVPGVDDWGAPTGVSLSADGVTLYLAQRSADGERERIVEIRRDCR
jgi:hypothetical protein